MSSSFLLVAKSSLGETVLKLGHACARRGLLSRRDTHLRACLCRVWRYELLCRVSEEPGGLHVRACVGKAWRGGGRERTGDLRWRRRAWR
eukprot:6186212-Pleurochrysis_carterae.AAC.3